MSVHSNVLFRVLVRNDRYHYLLPMCNTNCNMYMCDRSNESNKNLKLFSKNHYDPINLKTASIIHIFNPNPLLNYSKTNTFRLDFHD